VRALFVDRGFPVEPFAAALAPEIRCVEEVGPDEAGEVLAIVTGTPPVGAAEVAPYPNLRLVLTCTIGTDHLDLDALRARGIVVANTPTYCTEEVAEHALACALAGIRGLWRLDAAVRAGDWRYDAAGVPLRFEDARLGVVGLGRIGRALARRARALGIGVVAHDPFAAPGGDVPLLALDELLATSDVVSLHAPGGSGTLLGAAELGRMKAGALLVNMARPDLVDVDAMVAALHAGALGGAAWDVWPQEPADPADPRLAAPGLLVTPHAAWHSARADQAYRDEAISVLRDVLVAGRDPVSRVA
jgi:phosphoglycerate dehydrogenase-like enzyme